MNKVSGCASGARRTIALTSGDGFSFRWCPAWGAPAFNGGTGPFHELWEYMPRALGFRSHWDEDPEGGAVEAWARLRGLVDRGVPVQVGTHYSLIHPHGARTSPRLAFVTETMPPTGFGHHVVIAGYDLDRGTVTVYEPNDVMPHARYECPIDVFLRAWGEASQRAGRRYVEWAHHKPWNGEWTLHDGYGPCYELTEPVTEAEALSIMDHIFSEVGVFESPADVILSIEALREKPIGETISAYSKLANEIMNKNPEFTDEQVIMALAKQVYENHVQSPSSQAYVQRTISQGPAPTGEAAKLAAPERIIETERVPSAIEVEPGTAYREFLETEYGKMFAGGEELSPTERAMGEGETKPTVPPVRTMVASQEPAAINRFVKTGTQLWDKTVAEGFRWYSEWMNERLRRVGGPKSKALADSIDTIIATEKQRYGGLTPWLDPARREAGKLGKATYWAHKLNPVTPRAAIANVVGAVENTTPVPAFAQKLINLSRVANFKIGKMYEQANPRFKAKGQFQRNLTGFGYDVIRTGGGEAWDILIDGTAKANGIHPSIVEAFFKDWKKVLDDPGVDDIAIDKVNQDFQRKFPKAITHIKVDAAGVPVWQQVIHSDLFNYLETAARRASHATAFRDFFPNTTAGRRGFRKLIESVREELSEPYQNNLTSLMRALRGHPTDQYTRRFSQRV